MGSAEEFLFHLLDKPLNGPEFVRKARLSWAHRNRVALPPIDAVLAQRTHADPLTIARSVSLSATKAAIGPSAISSNPPQSVTG